jgi:hypothetical protein
MVFFLFSIISNNHELITQLRENSFNFFLCFDKKINVGFPFFLSTDNNFKLNMCHLKQV